MTYTCKINSQEKASEFSKSGNDTKTFKSMGFQKNKKVKNVNGAPQIYLVFCGVVKVLKGSYLNWGK